MFQDGILTITVDRKVLFNGYKTPNNKTPKNKTFKNSKDRNEPPNFKNEQ